MGGDEDQAKQFMAVPGRGVIAWLERQGWTRPADESSGSVWTVRGGNRDKLCYVCDDFDGYGRETYCAEHEDPVAALVYPVRDRPGAEAALRTLCAQERMTADELLHALTLRDCHEAHLYFTGSLFRYPADIENLWRALADLTEIMRVSYDAAGAEDANGSAYSHASLVAPDHVVFGYGYGDEDEEDPKDGDGASGPGGRFRAPARRAAERLQTTLNLLHPSPQATSVVRQYATGELTTEEVVSWEDFRPAAGPELELWDMLDNFRREHASFERWRFDWGLDGHQG
ncbi:hypothetical protein ACH4S8_26455 [Streptomyces sp. NPDC021080]|uniref:hypothetical protein n=1 Tax=Streptomyces sp. NPDC021080 TaxID=3365110 RepID=UPI0037B3039A